MDSAYSHFELEERAVRRAGGKFVRAVPSAETEDDVLALPDLGSASLLLVELAPITARVLSAALNCQAVIRYGTGLDNIDLDAASRLGIEVRGVPGYAADSVADHTLALMLALIRHVASSAAVVAAGSWRDDPRVVRPLGLRGTTLGLLGAGAIGRQVAARASGFGVRCIAYDPHVPDSVLMSAGIQPASFEEVLQSADILSLHLPLTPDTEHLISRKELLAMREGSFIINTSRGGLIDENALLEALDSGRIAGAGLDVTNPEPPAIGSPIRNHPGVILTPHTAFWSDQSEMELRSKVAGHIAELLETATVSNHIERTQS